MFVCPDVDDEYEDEDQWEDGAEDILEKGKKLEVNPDELKLGFILNS